MNVILSSAIQQSFVSAHAYCLHAWLPTADLNSEEMRMYSRMYHLQPQLRFDWATLSLHRLNGSLHNLSELGLGSSLVGRVGVPQVHLNLVNVCVVVVLQYGVAIVMSIALQCYQF